METSKANMIMLSHFDEIDDSKQTEAETPNTFAALRRISMKDVSNKKTIWSLLANIDNSTMALTWEAVKTAMYNDETSQLRATVNKCEHQTLLESKG